MSGHDRTPLSRTRPRSGVGVEADENHDGTYDTRLNGRRWKFDQDWEDVVRDARQAGHNEVQVIDATGYRAVMSI